MIDHNSSVPLYVQLEQALSRAIYEGEYRAGDKLPSENELCQKFQVSRITVRQALNLLTQKDLVFSAHGKGTFVKVPDIGQELDKIVSFRQVLQQKGLKGQTKVQSFCQEVSDSLARQHLGAQVCSLNLIGFAFRMPVVYYQSFFRPQLGQQMLTLAREAESVGNAFSTYDFYARLGIGVARIDQTVRAVNADQNLARLLELPRGQALMVLESLYIGEDGEVLEYKLGHYHSDIYSFRIHRRV